MMSDQYFSIKINGITIQDISCFESFRVVLLEMKVIYNFMKMLSFSTNELFYLKSKQNLHFIFMLNQIFFKYCVNNTEYSTKFC
jgi:hypothetical protein